MNTAERTLPVNVAPGRLQSAMGAFAAEASALLGALMQPGRLVAEVEQMGKLLATANGIEANDPARARQLRRRAAQIASN